MTMPTSAFAPSRPGDLAAGERRLEHPAVRAWLELGPERILPDTVDTLRVRGKSAIYRLREAGPGRSSVIAKRCVSATGRTERMIYQEILPRLPVPALGCFGLVEEPGGQFGWLFIEDAGEEEFSFASAEHARLVARWLATLHTAAARIQATARLPERGPEHYRDQLREARENILRHLTNPALRPDGLMIFRQILQTAEALESRWPVLEQVCQAVPRTFVHGDLKENNMRVRRTGEGLTLLPFDWEIAGWGTPAVDVWKCPDLDLYWSEVRSHWPGIERAALERLRAVGNVFRAVIAIYWESLDLGSEWVEWPVEKLRFYYLRLVAGLATLGLK